MRTKPHWIEQLKDFSDLLLHPSRRIKERDEKERVVANRFAEEMAMFQRALNTQQMGGLQ